MLSLSSSRAPHLLRRAGASSLMMCGMLGGTLTGAGAAGAGTVGEPTECAADEVTVVVQEHGQGCAPAGVTGMEALEKAGFEVTPVASFPGMVCQINGAPEGVDCSKPQKSDSFWGYFTAPLGGAWEFSQKGAAEQVTKAGTAEGWVYGEGQAPDTVPAEAEGGVEDSNAENANSGSASSESAQDAQDSQDGVNADEGTNWLPIAGVVLAIVVLGGAALAIARNRKN